MLYKADKCLWIRNWHLVPKMDKKMWIILVCLQACMPSWSWCIWTWLYRYYHQVLLIIVIFFISRIFNLDSLLRGIGLQQKYIVVVVHSSMYKRRPIFLYKLDFFQLFGHSKSMDGRRMKIDGWTSYEDRWMIVVWKSMDGRRVNIDGCRVTTTTRHDIQCKDGYVFIWE